MANQYQLSLNGDPLVKPSFDGLENVIVEIPCRYTAVADDGTTFFLDAPAKLSAPDKDNFISFEKITRDDLLAKAEEALKPFISDMQARLDAIIADAQAQAANAAKDPPPIPMPLSE